MEIDQNKILPDQTQIVGKIKFLNDTDKAGGKFLNSALAAIIERYVEDGGQGSEVGGQKGKKVKEVSPEADQKAKDQKLKTKDILNLQFADLPAEIRARRFREDFYYRLCSDQIRTPSLQEQLKEAPAELTPLVAFVLTQLVGDLALHATTMTINGFGFDTTASNNTVVFNHGAVGTVTASSATALTVSITTAPTAGILTAVVTSNDVSNGLAVQVASLKPVITTATTSLAANLTTLTIAGSGFDTTTANNVVTFNNGAVGTVTDSTPTSLTVSISTKPIAGNLFATVTTNGASGIAVQVATINPVVTASTINLSLNGTSLVVSGFGFSPVVNSNAVTFAGGAVGKVTAATTTSLTILFTTKPTAAAALNGSVTTSGRSSGAAVQMAQVVAATTAPTITSSASSLSANAATRLSFIF